jgi:hypothetical protein
VLDEYGGTIPPLLITTMILWLAIIFASFIRLRATPPDRIEQERQNRAYLVGEAFSVADLTAAALLGVLLQPSEIQYPLQVALPLYLKDYRAPLLRHPAAQWAAGIYGCIADTPRKLPRARPRRSILEK